ncbi:MAG: hypothetical protein KJZ75_09080 [Hyphomonadaceae bacterium]|nr:hypothetical protein [Hyphomonadaceae bacterium]GIK47944.1 MAG: hypothetical protein BroJett013_06410 [Alphaproteobacteria bacterium]
MSRVKLVLKPSDYPGNPDEATKADVKALFDHMFPGVDNPEIPGTAGAFGVVAQEPRLALRLIHVSDYVVRQMEWTAGRRDLQQLMVQTLNYYHKCDFSFLAHIKPASVAGVSVEQQAAIPFWRTANVFNDEQRLIIEFTLAVCACDVPDELFQRVVDRYGERQAIEISVGVGWWSMWAMIIAATRPTHEFEYGGAKS